MRKGIVAICSLIAFALLAASPTAAAILKVPKVYSTIQAAIDAANPGDTVMVDDGTYDEHITLKSGVIVQGAGAEVTTIQGDGTGSVVTADEVDASAKIDGFTITGGGG